MPVKRCRDCGTHFEFADGEQWKLLCIDCWKASKRREAGPASYSGNRDTGIDERLRSALSENNVLRARLALLETRMAVATREPQFDRDDLLTLRRLCHPDRHSGSESSTRMSQRINAELQRMQP